MGRRRGGGHATKWDGTGFAPTNKKSGGGEKRFYLAILKEGGHKV